MDGIRISWAIEMAQSEILLVTLDVSRILEGLAVPYFIGGSMASSVHGVPRSTQDVDLVADLRMEHVEPLSAALGKAYYHDLDLMREAVRRKGSFNLIHIVSVFKVDVFVLEDNAFSREAMNRRQLISVGDDALANLWFCSPEDTVIQKLHWYRLGGGVSDRQWGDVLGILKVRRAHGPLNIDYMKRCSAALGVEDLLKEAFLQAGICEPGQ